MITIGDKTVSSIFLGSTKVKEAYLGDKRIWPSRGVVVTYMDGTKADLEYTEIHGYNVCDMNSIEDKTLVVAIDFDESATRLYKSNYGTWNGMFAAFPNITSVTFQGDAIEYAYDDTYKLYSLTWYDFYRTSIKTFKFPRDISGKVLNNFIIVPFMECSNLESVDVTDLPQSIKIGNAWFKDCPRLREIIGPIRLGNGNGAQDNSQAFYGCTSLSALTIQEGVSKLGKRCFYKCSSLETLTFLDTTPPTLEDSTVFERVNEEVRILVPSGSVTAYKEAWPELATKIHEIP